MLKVMIVDDMEIIIREIKRFEFWGEESGFVISQIACNGHDALKKLEASPVDIIITDVKMPKINGFELLEKVNEKNLCPCVILLSDYDDYNHVRQGIRHRAFDYITKPIDMEELLCVLKSAETEILEKRSKSERIQLLEAGSLSKVENFYGENEIQNVSELIWSQQEEAFSLTKQLVDKVGLSFNYDLVKVDMVLRNFMYEIMDRTIKNYSWICKFIDVKKILGITFLDCKEFDGVWLIMSDSLKSIMFYLNKLQCGNKNDSFVNEICKCALENVDGEISLNFVASTIYMNKTYISQTFKKKTKSSFVEYITMVKMERAKKLISEEKSRIYEVSYKLGFKDVEYFSRVFKKYTGLTPTEFGQKLA